MIIKEGKTNWNFLLIVIILAVIVGGGILWWIDKQDFSINFFEVKIEKQKASNCSDIRFEDYSVEEIYEGEIAEVDFESNPSALTFYTRITEGAKEGPNFAGHYTIVTWGCGSSCGISAIIDSKTGEIVHYGPSALYAFAGIDYNLNSRLVIVEPSPLLTKEGELVSRYYEFKNGKLEFICEKLEKESQRKTADCLEKYPEVEYKNCVPGEILDGWSGVILYPNTFDFSDINHYIDAPAPDAVEYVGVARYGNSPSTCRTSWSIKTVERGLGLWKEVSQIEFCNYIIHHNDTCDNCLIEWEEGCC